jgi:nucleoside-diphosphate-sugar epimerase
VRLLLTGASGLIGRQFRKELLPPGCELITTSRGKKCLDSDEHHSTDLADPELAAALVRFVRPTHIIHLAWETTPPTYWEDPVNSAWQESTARMAAAFGETGGRRFIQVGSCAEYDWAGGVCREEATPDRPTTLYGKAKLASFHAVQAAAHEKFEAVEARIFFIYGPGERPERFVPTICRSHLQGEVPMLGSGRVKRDFLHSNDVARALAAIACAPRVEGVINVGSGIPTPLAEVAEILADLAGADETGLGRAADRAGEPDTLVASIDRLRGIGWAPRLTIRQGLKDIFEWWRNELQRSS